MIYISSVPGLGLGLIHFGLGLEKFLWPRPRPRPWPRAKLASLTSLNVTCLKRCPASPGVCMPGLAYEHHKRSDKIARRYPACSPGHRRQHPVRRSMLYAELISAG